VQELTVSYVNQFNAVQIANVKNLLEREEWERMPIPDNFTIKEISDPLSEYPKSMETLLNVFANFYRA
jgi:hypothetical protein